MTEEQTKMHALIDGFSNQILELKNQKKNLILEIQDLEIQVEDLKNRLSEIYAIVRDIV